MCFGLPSADRGKASGTELDIELTQLVVLRRSREFHSCRRRRCNLCQDGWCVAFERWNAARAFSFCLLPLYPSSFHSNLQLQHQFGRGAIMSIPTDREAKYVPCFQPPSWLLANPKPDGSYHYVVSVLIISLLDNSIDLSDVLQAHTYTRV